VLLKDEFFCDGNSDGYLEAKYFSKVVSKKQILLKKKEKME